jgi:hypothetical protein
VTTASAADAFGIPEMGGDAAANAGITRRRQCSTHLHEYGVRPPRPVRRSQRHRRAHRLDHVDRPSGDPPQRLRRVPPHRGLRSVAQPAASSSIARCTRRNFCTVPGGVVGSEAASVNRMCLGTLKRARLSRHTPRSWAASSSAVSSGTT